MRRITTSALVAVMAAMPVAAFAQDAVIRIEAKRGQAAADAAAENWRQSFDNVVTLALKGGWVGVALGPLKPGEAKARLAELKAEGKIPDDSFVSVLSDNVILQAADGDTSSSTAASQSQQELVKDGPSSYIRLQSFQDQAKADQALKDWRTDFPAAGMWQLPNGWFTIAIGPLEEDTADAWLKAFKHAEAVPKDAFISDTAEIGNVTTRGANPDLPAPGQTEEMPPMVDVQRALQWAGLYDGVIDGRAGSETLAAINAEVIGERFSPDPGTAMHNLLERRAKWGEKIGLTELKDEHTGLSLTAPMNRLKFERTERALSIYGPKDDSGAALILFNQEGGQQELVDMSGLVTALGWVPKPERVIENNHIMLTGQNDDFSGYAEGWVNGGRIEGFVLIWPASDTLNRNRLIAEMRDTVKSYSPDESDGKGEDTASVADPQAADEAQQQP